MYIGYGIGQYYETVKSKLPKEYKLSYLCDLRKENYKTENGYFHDGLQVLSVEDARKHIGDATFVVFSGNARNTASIVSEISSWGGKYILASSLVAIDVHIAGEMLRSWTGDGKATKVSKDGKYRYTDESGNTIEYYDDIEKSISIALRGENNFLSISKRVSVGELYILMGTNGYCSIGEETIIESARIHVSFGKVEIGENCLFAERIIIRNHDAHHIFSRSDGNRINHPRNISIGNHVWIGLEAMLLGGFTIGDNSVVGTRSVTSSTFPKEVIIAGNPAKVIREGICWSKDNTDYFDHDNLDDCMAKEAYLYFE